MIKVDIGDLDGAIADFSEAIRLNPDGIAAEIAYHGRGLIKADISDPDGVIADYSEVIRLDPVGSNPIAAIAYYHRALIPKEIGQCEAANADLEKANAVGGFAAEYFDCAPEA